MKIKLLLLLLILLGSHCFANDHANDSFRIASLNQQVADLNAKLITLNSDVKNKVDYQNSLIQTSFNGVSTQISSATVFLTIFSIIITLIAIAVGFYVSHVQKKVQSILKANEEIRIEVYDLNDMIQHNLKSLYQKLELEETRNFIKRLNIVPEDITNIGSMLLTRSIPTDEYNNVKKAYLKYKEKHANVTILEPPQGSFLILLFQHFAGFSYSDELVGKDIELHFQYILSAAFENDILQSTGDIIKEYINSKISKEKINSFLRAIIPIRH